MTREELSHKTKNEIIDIYLKQMDEYSQRIAALTQTIADLKETLEEFKRMIFASKSEKKHVGYDDPNQLSLSDIFNEAELEADPSAKEPDAKEAVEGYLRNKAGQRKPKATHEELYDQLPVKKLQCKLSEEDKICPRCGREMQRIGWELVRTELEIIPAQVRKVEILQEKVRCSHCYDETGCAYIESADVPSPLIPHSIASPSTVAYVMYQKYINSMPLYRQEKDWLQMGVKIQRATLANWCITCGMNYLKPIYEAMIRHLLERNSNGADETPCQVLKEEGKTAQQKSYMWLHCSTGLDGLPPIMIYEYSPTRSGQVATDFYKDFKGKYIIMDGYQGYNHLPDGVIRCGCLAHFRRKFYTAIPSEDRKTGKSSSPAAKVVNLCDRLFRIERGFIDLTPEDRKARREASDEHKIWDEIWTYLDTISASKTSLLGKAVTYALNQKPYMENYFLCGEIPISNNFTESCGARPYAVGRKNFYFHDTVKGAEASAIIYSLALTAKYNKLSVFKYLKTVLLYMPGYLDESEDIEDMMPWSDMMKAACSIEETPIIEEAKK
jgi:transposase